MKKLLLLILLTILISCGGDDDNSNTLNVDSPPDDTTITDTIPPNEGDDIVIIDPPILVPPPVIIIDPPIDPPVDPGVIIPPVIDPIITPETIKLSLSDSNNIIFYDGTNFMSWNTGAVRIAGMRQITFYDILYTLDEYGETVSTDQLIIPPDYIHVVGSDTWIIEDISPADALALGAMYRNYTRIWKNNIEDGLWFMNEWKTEKLIKTFSGDIIAVENTGAYHLVNGTASNIFHADKLFIYDFDVGTKTATIKYDAVYQVSWLQNYISSARYWIKADGIFYSNNGYTWTPAGLNEQVNKLWDFNSTPYGVIIPNGEFAYVIDAGIRFENGENVIYWLECNSGWLFRFVPSINKLEMKYRLYFGDGMRQTGILYSKTIKPVIIENDLYFTDINTVWKLDLDTGNVTSFYGGDYEVREW